MRRWLSKFRYTHVAIAEGRATLVRQDGTATGIEMRCYWQLSENGFGKRRAKRSGTKPSSAHANYAEARVNAWLSGGDLPESLLGVAEPVKAQPKKPDFQLIAFPKEDAHV